MKTIQCKNLIFNSGLPKICIPLTGKNITSILGEINDLNQVDHDLAELRIDLFEDVDDFSKVVDLLKKIREIYFKPLLFTFRTKKEGGVHDMSEENYFELIHMATDSGLIDMVDIELFSHEESLRKAVAFAHEKHIKVVMSNHDFHKTPDKDEIIKRLVKMQENGADISKIAVMPTCNDDVLELLSATMEVKNKYGFPCITMSMGRLGAITRLSGELFGSCMTFAVVKNTSAPGQISAAKVKEVLDLLHFE
ncbi:MAG: type I 3-dehydroquinate dehydratase [Sedimentibacter saalensis]|uniref:type I 3-dehydroquinate dehydratase n=1 Tax=Sedimentibacter saalensis TaxID=130788 RepID=UPI002B21F180|nr:type I 3-dehydroquinate dehydratase [Sedimentibacter saalensis]MEA5094031.1 type I 3-dehydroquinate dehydratase [Sedimentibacter saalensis]